MSPPDPRTHPARRTLVLGTLLGVMAAAVYAGTLGHGFVWDDDLHVTANPTIIGPLGLKEIWTSARANYFPLVLTNFWLQHATWGLNPAGYHAVTVLCHALSAVLLWRVLAALRVPGAWIGAALWALHPVQVESVAWISELKNTQSAIFFLLAARFFVRWLDAPAEGKPARSAYLLTLACAAMALMSKPSTVMLPVALALMAWWRRGALRRRELTALAPFFFLSALVSGWTIWEQKFHSGAVGADWSQTGIERGLIAGRVIWFYLGKLVWPHPLVFIYPRWTVRAEALLDWVPLLLVGLVLLGLWLGRTGPWRPVWLAGLYFGALLFPVLGFFDVYFFRYSFVGDHFQYLASMGPLALAGAGLARLPRWVGSAVTAVLLTVLGGLTVQQARIYKDHVALWSATVAENPVAAMAWMNLADSLSKEGRHLEAIVALQRGLALRPDAFDAYSDLGCEYVLVGRPAEALVQFDTALRLQPDNPVTHNNRGNALCYLGRREEGVAEYRRALVLRPGYGEAHYNLGTALVEIGHAAEALEHFDVALQVNPRQAEAYDNRGNALRALGRGAEAIAAHRTALRLRPDFAEAHNNLAIDLAAAGRSDEAISHFERALSLKPDFVAASGGLAKLLADAGRETDALRRLEAALRAAPNSAGAHNNLGSHLARFGHGAEAIGAFEQALRLDPALAAARMNLGAALGAAGRWLEAAKQFEVAAKLLPGSADAFAGLGVALGNSGRLETAALSFARALQLDASSAVAHEQLAQVLQALGREREASDHAAAAQRLRRAPPASAAETRR